LGGQCASSPSVTQAAGKGALFMAIDPICGMNVDEATARSAERDGKTVYFCSEHCRQKAHRRVENFLLHRAKP